MTQPASQAVRSFEAENARVGRPRWPALWDHLQRQPVPEALFWIPDCPHPTLMVGGHLLSSTYDPLREARIQAGRIPPDATSAWVYGPGIGLLPQLLLERKGLRRLRVVPLAPALFRQALCYFDQRDWLGDPRIELLLPEPSQEIATPFACTAPELALAEAAGARLRDRVQVALDDGFTSAQHREQEPFHLARMERNRDFLAHDAPVSALHGRHPGAAILVAAAGPTLNDHLDWIRARRDGQVLVAVDAALHSLLAADLVPDYVVTIDAHEERISRYFAMTLTPCRHGTLVYFPVTGPAILRRWPGPRRFAHNGARLYRDFASRHPGALLWSAGSVLHAAVDLAVRLGAGSVLLAGADFGYPGSALHANPAAEQIYQGLAEGVAGHWIENGRGERIATNPAFRAYLRDLERYLAEHPAVDFLRLGLEGAAIAGTRAVEP